MLAVHLVQTGPNTDLSWVLYILLGVFLFVIIIGAFTAGGGHQPDVKSGHESRRTTDKAIKPETRKKSRK
jgi:hypothetical protein